MSLIHIARTTSSAHITYFDAVFPMTQKWPDVDGLGPTGNKTWRDT
jgi:hypothetical protein